MISALPEPAPSTPDTAKAHLMPLLFLLALVIITYHELPGHSFLDNWDDPGYITENQAIRGINTTNLKTAFTHHYVGNYAPVQIISYMLDYSVWGLNSAGFLFSNIVIHFLNSVLLYLFLLRNGIHKWGAVLGSALFLVHPVQMESVAWLSQRKNLLAMFFSLLGFHFYQTYRFTSAKAGLKWYFCSFTAFVLALLSKPVAVIFPLILILYDRFMSGERLHTRHFADKVPYFLAAFAIGVITVIIQTPDVTGGRISYPADAWRVLPLTMLPVLVSYLGLLIWPSPSTLSIIYTTPLKQTPDAPVFIAAGIAAGLILCGIYLYRTQRSACFWYCLFFISLLPVSQIIPLVTMMNDRYLYFPMIGIAGLTGHFLSAGLNHAGQKYTPILTAIAAITIIAALSIACHFRGKVWLNSITLFKDAVIKAPHQLNPLQGLAEGYRAAGNNEMALKYYDQASTYGYLDADVSYNLARIYLERGELEKARNHIWGGLLKSRGSEEGILLLEEYKRLSGNSQQ